MTSTIPQPSKFDFYRRFVMARAQFDPHEFGVNMDREPFIDLMCEEFNAYVRGTLSIDELLLRPRTAINFCDMIRGKHGWHDLPDDIILRVIMRRRKNPGE
jgi:hypothetical protein